jgi:hypothetical protein
LTEKIKIGLGGRKPGKERKNVNRKTDHEVSGVQLNLSTK